MGYPVPWPEEEPATIRLRCPDRSPGRDRTERLVRGGYAIVVPRDDGSRYIYCSLHYTRRFAITRAVAEFSWPCWDPVKNDRVERRKQWARLYRRGYRIVAVKVEEISEKELW